MLRNILLLFLFSLPLFCIANDAGQLLFEHLDVDKLPNNSVTNLAQDEQGFIWIGTQKGVARFNGYDYRTTFGQGNVQEVLSSSYIRALHYDHNNQIMWIGTMSDGLFAYNISTNKLSQYLVQNDNLNSLRSNRIESIVNAPEGGVWLGTYSGLSKFDITTGRFVHYQHQANQSNSLDDDRVRTLLTDSQGNLWVGTWKGLNLLSIGQDTIKTIDSTPNKLTGEQVFRLFESSDGQIWIGTFEHGITVYNPKTDTFRHMDIAKDIAKDSHKAQNSTAKKHAMDSHTLSHSLIMGFIEPKPNQIWVATFGGGIDVLDSQTLRVTKRIKHDTKHVQTIADNTIGSMLLSNEHQVWIGTWGHGLNRYHNNAGLTLLLGGSRQNILHHPDIFAVTQYKNQLWVGTRGKGVAVIDQTLNKSIDIKQLYQLNDAQITNLVAGPKGNMWIGTLSQGLFKYSPITHQLIHYHQEHLPNNLVETMVFDRQGFLWIGTHDGLVKLDPSNEITTNFVQVKQDKQSLSNNVIQSLALGIDTTLWVGTHNGLNAFNTATGKVRRFKHEPSNSKNLSHNHINSLLMDSHNQLWIASANDINLLQINDKKEYSFKSLNFTTGNKKQWYENLALDKSGNVWAVAGFKELIKIKPNLSEFTLFDRADGVYFGHAWTGSFTSTTDGMLFFGGTGGLLRVDPQSLTKRYSIGKILFEHLQVDGVSATKPLFQPKITFSKPIRRFQLEFAQLNYFRPNKIKYQYRLVGFSDQWTVTDAAHRQVSFNNLAPGNYRLEIKTVIPKGQSYSPTGQSPQATNGQSQTLEMTLPPTYWQTSSFKFLILISFILLTFSLIQWRTRQLGKRTAFLQSVVDKRTSELLTLAEVVKELNATLDVQSITDRLQKHLAASMNAHVFALAIIDIHRNKLCFRNVIENNQPLEPFDIDLDNDNHVAIACIRQSSPIALDKAEDAVRFLGKQAKPMAGDQMQSILYHPLTSHEGKVIGCLTVQSPQKNAYSQSDKKLMYSLASSTAIALDNARAYNALEKASLTDYLTTLPNRRAFFDFANTLMARSKRNRSTFALVLTDIDHFKVFNDKYGHDIGDYVLQNVSVVLKETIREQDHVCRWGGEEFILLLPDTTLDGATTLAEKLRQAIEQALFSQGDLALSVTMTFGVTTHQPDKAILDSVNRADALLYRGKSEGRNRVIGDNDAPMESS